MCDADLTAKIDCTSSRRILSSVQLFIFSPFCKSLVTHFNDGWVRFPSFFKQLVLELWHKIAC